MRKLRLVLTVIVLALFSLESLAGISFGSTAHAITSKHQVSHTAQGPAFFSFLTEENENEERVDDKAHGSVLYALPVFNSFSICQQASKISFSSPDLSPSFGHQRVLTLICRLLI